MTESTINSPATSLSNVPRPMVAFDSIPYDEVVWGEILGKGAFGSVYKGSYLGIDIAIKEIEPSQKYHVMKYFEREWRIMAECRHPNIVLFLGLCMAPKEDGRCFIVSEYVPKGNLRSFMLGRRPFPWRLRLSFATDIARAIAYLHARDCVHRDIKGENLLITSNDRIKVTDFGFARILTASSEEERARRQMTHCGTEWYMSPEMVNGEDFDLPTDVYTLGLVFIELLSRKLVARWLFVLDEDNILVVDPEEVYRVASPYCPQEFINLALDCCAVQQEQRPKMPQVLERLRLIELDVFSRLTEDDGGEHVGSISIVKPGRGRAMPDFSKPSDDEMTNQEVEEAKVEEEALVALSTMKIDGTGPTHEGEGESGVETWRTAQWKERSDITMSSESSFGHKGHLLRSGTKYHDSRSSFDQSGSGVSNVPVVAVENASVLNTATPPHDADVDAAMSTMTIRAPMSTSASGNQVMGENGDLKDEIQGEVKQSDEENKQEEKKEEGGAQAKDAVPPETPIPPQSQLQSIPSLNTSVVDSKPAEGVHGLGLKEQEEEQEEEADQPSRVMGTHRFSVLNKDLLELHENNPKKKEKAGSKTFTSVTSAFSFSFWNKPQTSGTGANMFWKRDQGPSTKCAVCKKRLGHRPALECDDCGTIVHATCSHSTPRDCQVWEQVAE